ncbi:sugar porter family MFS transporter [Lactiplantibacillus nangangensis]|uniref:Sugar porter family MFS transporter n=1 Tax=Lactiplantibacillus nangangensis TaxID=2559917 RepID=A0ABW1SGD4_9LACO|nr:sugar porter family MFS transporter [Lactiplantibacillus nangangensis]
MASKEETHRKFYVILISLAAGMAGLLYGYDTACISGAIGFLKTLYHLSPAAQGFITSSIMIGGVVGVAFSGFLSDRFGRRKILMWGAGLFFIAALLSAATHSPAELIGARIIGGIGIGLASSLATTYISEVAPAAIRGTLSSLYQLLTTIGIALTYFVNLLIVNQGGYHWGEVTGWRWMLGIGAVPALLFFIALVVAPESPRWLIQHTKVEAGFNILVKINGQAGAQNEMTEIATAIRRDRNSTLAKLFQPGLRRALGIGIFLAFCNQAAGMNVIMYYGPQIFQTAGFGGNSQFMATAGIGVVNMLATIGATLMIDRAGRKKLLMVGAGLLTAWSAAIAYAFASGNGLLLLVSLFGFVISFAISMGPIPWIMIPELFPTYLRARASGICTVFLWGANWAVGQFTPVMLNAWGGRNTFIFFALMNVIIFVGVHFFVPETKDKTLEEIEAFFWPKNHARATDAKVDLAQSQNETRAQVKKADRKTFIK